MQEDESLKLNDIMSCPLGWLLYHRKKKIFLFPVVQ